MRRWTAAVVAAAACVATGCTGGGEPEPLPDTTIEIFGPYRGVEADRFVETLKPFVDETNVAVRYIGSVDFVEDLVRRTGEGNDPPDVAIVPQPGLIRMLAEDGDLVALSPAVRKAISENYAPEVARLGVVDGTPYAVPFRLTVKSLVWYRPAVFEAHDWAPPSTLDELDRLVERMAGSGELAPWCFAMEAGSATGWAATDWTEDLVLRRAGPDVYRRWATGAVPFADPAIEAAFDDFRRLVLAPGNVAGGLSSVVETPVEDAIDPLFAEPPGCALYKQADFATAWMPDGTTIGPDADVNWFVLPGAVASGGAPIVLGGDAVVQFRRDSHVDALMSYLAGPSAGGSWVKEGGFLSPKSSIPDDAYPDDSLQALVAVIGDASALAFDASDQMPPAIGSGLLWKDITGWVAGTMDYDAFAGELDAARATASAGPTP